MPVLEQHYFFEFFGIFSRKGEYIALEEMCELRGFLSVGNGMYLPNGIQYTQGFL